MPTAPASRCLDCRRLHAGAGRCPDCRRRRDEQRGRRQARGYDAAHDALGRDYQRRMDGGERFTCWRCKRPVGTRRGTQWQLGHCDNDRTVHHGPEHTSCNLATAGRHPGTCPHPSHDAPPQGGG